MASRSVDDELARLAIDQGLITPAQLEECRTHAHGDDARGVIHYMVAQGYLTDGAVSRLERELFSDTVKLAPSPAPIEAPAFPLPPDVARAMEVPSNRFGPEDRPGVPRFVLLDRIGRGGMGYVHKAFQPALGRTVAIKFLKENEPEDVERFTREARAAARLNHPNIAQIYEAGAWGGRPYIALQYIEGKSLARADLDPRKVAGLISKIARALHYAHAQGIVHRDVKPGNILLCEAGGAAGQPFLVDFGLARQEQDLRQTATGVALGTPYYMAPEQVRADSNRIGPHTDVYGLGATLYDLVTLRPPFPLQAGAQIAPVEVYRQVLEEEVIPPRRIVPKVPRDLEVIIQRALAKEPDRRFASAAALAEDLERFLGGEPIRARPSTALYRVRKRVSRHRAVSALVVAIAVVVALGAWAVWSVRRHGKAQELLAEAEKAYELPDYAGAAERAKAVLRIEPGNVRAGLLRARALMIVHLQAHPAPAPWRLRGLVSFRPADSSDDPRADIQAALDAVRDLGSSGWEREYAEGLRAFALEDWTGAASRLASARDAAEGKTACEIALWGVQAVFRSGDFGRAMSDVQALRRLPGFEHMPRLLSREIDLVHAQIFHSRALEEDMRGEDADATYQAALDRLQDPDAPPAWKRVRSAILVSWAERDARFGRGGWEERLAQAQAVLESGGDPDSDSAALRLALADVHRVRGETLAHGGKIREAQGEFNEAVRLCREAVGFSRRVDTVAHLGLACYSLTQLLEDYGFRIQAVDHRLTAQQELLAAASLDEGKTPDIPILLAELLGSHRDRREEALGRLDELLRARRDCAPAWYVRGWVLLRDAKDLAAGHRAREAFERCGEAVDAFSRAIGINGEYVRARMGRAEASYLRARWGRLLDTPADPAGEPASREDLDEALRVTQGGDYAVHTEVGKLLLREGNDKARVRDYAEAIVGYEESIRAFEQALDRNGQASEPKVGLSRARIQWAIAKNRTGTPPEGYRETRNRAVQDLEELIGRNPYAFEAYQVLAFSDVLLARVPRDEERWPDAVTGYERALGRLERCPEYRGIPVLLEDWLSCAAESLQARLESGVDLAAFARRVLERADDLRACGSASWRSAQGYAVAHAACAAAGVDPLSLQPRRELWEEMAREAQAAMVDPLDPPLARELPELEQLVRVLLPRGPD